MPATAALAYTRGCDPEQYEDRTANSLNQVATIQDPGDSEPFTLVYDKSGNLLDDGTLKYEYDAFNRLKKVDSVRPTTLADLGSAVAIRHHGNWAGGTPRSAGSL